MQRLIRIIIAIFLLCAAVCINLVDAADFCHPKAVAEDLNGSRQKSYSAHEDNLKIIQLSKTDKDSDRTQNELYTEDDPSVVLEVTGFAVCDNYNHVGNEWENKLYLNDEEVKGFAEISVKNGEYIIVEWVIREGKEKYPDEERYKEEILIMPEIMTKGYRIRKTVVVTESNGRYAGNNAEWLVTIEIVPQELY